MPLSKRCILITRPVDFQDPLSRLIQAKGGLVIALPTICCEPVFVSKDSLEIIAHLDQAWGAICVSQFAVQFALALIQNQWKSVLPKLNWFAIGPATAACLRKQGISELYYPLTPPFNSEALLALSALQKQQIAQKKIIIFKGEAGRRLLLETLTQRKANVQIVDLYERVIPKESIQLAKSVLKNHKIDSIVATSQTGIENLMTIIPNPERGCLLKIPLVVVGARLSAFAKKVGFQTVWISTAAGDQAILETLLSRFI